jgi:hypothetical protein
MARRHGVGVCKTHRLPRKRIDVSGLIILGPVGAAIHPVHVVDKEEDDVWPSALDRRGLGGGVTGHFKMYHPRSNQNVPPRDVGFLDLAGYPWQGRLGFFEMACSNGMPWLFPLKKGSGNRGSPIYSRGDAAFFSCFGWLA